MPYRVLVGVNYPPNHRAEPGDVVNNLPRKSLPWLLRQGIVEKINDPEPEPEPDLVDDSDGGA